MTGTDPLTRFLPAAAAAILLLALVLVMPRGSFVIDEAGKYLQTVSLAGEFRFPPAVPYPGAGLLGAVAEDARPLPYHYGFLRDGRLYSQYSPLLALLCLPGFLLAGRTGVFLFPAAAAFVLWLVLRRILRERGFGKTAACTLPLLGTPLLFYSQTLWSYTAVAAACLAAWHWQGKAGFATSAGLVFSAALLRVEAMLLLPFLFFREGRNSAVRRLLLTVAFAAAFLAAQKLLTGQWLGTHITASGVELELYGHRELGFLQGKIFVFSRALFHLVPGAPESFSFAAGSLLWLLWGLSWIRRSLGSFSLYAGLVLTVSVVTVSALRGFGVFDLFFLKHPLVIFPVLWLVRPGEWKLPACMVLVLLLAAGPMHVEDLAWGTRLIMIPLFLLSAGASPEKRRIPPVAVTGLLCALLSVALLWTRRARSEELVGLVDGRCGAVVTTNWLLPGEFACLQAEGTPVVMTDRSGAYLHALDSFGGLSPVVVCLERDLQTTLEVTGDRGGDMVIEGVVGFDPSMRVAVITF